MSIAILKSNSYKLFLLLAFFSFASGAIITSQLSLFLFITILLLAVNIIIIAFSENSLMLPGSNYSNLFVLLFLIIIFYTMLVRGIGFETLNSNKSGGMFYVKLFTVLLLFVFVVKIKMSDRFISLLFLSFFISPLLTFFSDVIYLLFGTETFVQRFVPGSSTIEFFSANEGLLRIQSAASVAEYIFVLMLAYNPIFKEKGRLNFNKGNLSVMLLVLILIGLSGHRIMLVGISLLLLFYFTYSFGFKKLIKPLLIGGTVAAAISVLVILEFNKLPSSFQRVFSFLPFTSANAATADASASLDFRVVMAAKAFMMLPDYFLIGKGFAFYNYSVNMTDFFGIVDLFAEIGVFHNGLIGLLINLGIPGLLVGVSLIFSILQLTKKKVSTIRSPLLNNFLLVLKCKLIVSVIYFFVLYGDVQTNFMEIIMLAILYKIIHFHVTRKVVAEKGL